MTQPLLPQAKQREDEQNHNDQADEINQTMHVALPKLPLPWQAESKITLGKKVPAGRTARRDEYWETRAGM
jgi:hypothetical protein